MWLSWCSVCHTNRRTRVQSSRGHIGSSGPGPVFSAWDAGSGEPLCSLVIQTSHSDEFQEKKANCYCNRAGEIAPSFRMYCSLAEKVCSGPSTYTWCLTAVGIWCPCLVLMYYGLDSTMG